MGAPSTEPPRYVRIADELQRRWQRLAPNTQVESEMQLAERFDVNRQTAREVLRELERRNAVRRIVGRGTFTALKLDYPIERGRPPSFRRIVRAAGHRHELVSTSVRWRSTARGRELTSRRVIAIDGLTASVAEDRFVENVGERVADAVRSGDSIFETLQSLGVQPWRRRVTVRMASPDHRTALELGYVGAPTPTWHVESETVDADTATPLHRSATWMRADVFDVGVHLDFPPDPSVG